MTTMTHVLERPIADCESKLLMLWNEVQSTPIAPRVQLWVEHMCGGRKMSEFLRDASLPPRERLTVAQRLTDILLGKNYDALPQLTVVPRGSRVPEVEQVASTSSPSVPSATDDLQAMVRQEVRREMASLLETLAKQLRETR